MVDMLHQASIHEQELRELNSLTSLTLISRSSAMGEKTLFG
jgi:hypothetical protein